MCACVFLCINRETRKCLKRVRCKLLTSMKNEYRNLFVFTYKTFIPVYSFPWHLYKHTDSEFLIPSNFLYTKHTLEILKICVLMMLGDSKFMYVQVFSWNKSSYQLIAYFCIRVLGRLNAHSYYSYFRHVFFSILCLMSKLRC